MAGKTKKSRATRQVILKAAMELFRTKGFRETTMRDIAKEASIALGATYYYFGGKEDIVMAFYYETLEEQGNHLARAIKETSDFEERVKKVLRYRLEQLAPYRHFLGVLAQVAIDPESSLSPFSSATKPVRDRSIALFAKLVEGTRVSVPAELRKHFPRILWLYHLGILLHWIYDRSPNQQKTARLIEKSLGLILKILGILRLPFMGAAIRPLVDMMEEKQ